uniref:DNA-directed RNA polymerase III subunit RPC3 n=1 Tax=Globisporangium ultimum (strain ATCC 200006 / CBS 805.95 / DAOM BR144) TaxID=431595 RepID=K3X6M8_GLOUD
MSSRSANGSGGGAAAAIAAPSTFATRSERAIVLSVLRDDFGDIAEKIAAELLRADGLRLVEIVHKVQAAAVVVKPSVHEIKCTLLKMLQHNVLGVKPAAASRSHATNGVVYNIIVQEVLYRLRFPTFIEQAKQAFGIEGEVIMEEILVHGRVRIDQAVESMAYSLAELKHQQAEADEEISESELDESRELIRAAFVEMAKKRYISRVHPLDMTVPEQEQQPDFPASIMRGNDGSTGKPKGDANTAESNKRGAASGNGAASVHEKTDDDDGITVRGKKKKQTSVPSNAIPIELQMMLEADDARKRDDETEAEFDPETSRSTKKRKLSKRAKLPTRGAAATSAESEAGSDSPSGAMGEQSLVWRFGVDQLMRDLRHKACTKFATENINNVAGVIVGAMLKHSSPHEREKDEPTSFPVTARELFGMDEVKRALPKDSKDTWRLLLNYITVMCRDKSGMVMKVAQETFDATQARPGDGGQYVVHMKKIVEFLRQATTHSYIQEKYGVQSARIVRLLLEKRQLEQKTIGELALLPSNDARRRLYELFTENLVKMQEIPKRADHSPAFTVFCWSVDLPLMEKSVAERILTSLCKLRARRKMEAEQNKDLIARSDQLVEANDLAKFDKLSRALDRLDRAIIQLDAMLMLYRDF